jgi:hypothetical protein
VATEFMSVEFTVLNSSVNRRASSRRPGNASSARDEAVSSAGLAASP